ncbi:hypothetical protein DLAC_06429 [Tieghemostelium lacteum]|uniref:Uncharacterized protein n=1 Tax=Tieghemostelium lacteum TaxID=361077 RepID=A0A151ZEV1_TIELA|nr:hypothetical protein DLAC_06429 [Tieghemostelium lacteum]|eukprot:KYQ92447.1 hypothetical protein DLAC_06429 [Tieghemostelium lacteum]
MIVLPTLGSASVEVKKEKSHLLSDLKIKNKEISRVLEEMSKDIASLIIKFKEISFDEIEEPQQVTPQEVEEIEVISREERSLPQDVELWSYDDRIEVYQVPGDQDALMKLKSQMESLVTAVHQYNHNYNFIDLVYQCVLDKELMLNGGPVRQVRKEYRERHQENGLAGKNEAIGLDELMISYQELFAKCRIVKYSNFTMAYYQLVPDEVRVQTNRDDSHLFFSDLDAFVNNTGCQEISLKIDLSCKVSQFVGDNTAIVEKLDSMFGSENYGPDAQIEYQKLKDTFELVKRLPSQGDADLSKLQNLIRVFIGYRDWLINHLESIANISSDEAEYNSDSDDMIID